MRWSSIPWVRFTGLVLAGACAGPGNASPGASSLQEAGALWSVEPLRVVEPPAGAHPVDALLKSAEGPAADRRALMRRVSYGLTGLPPDRDSVERFVEDERSDEEAFEGVVEALLS